MSNRVRRLENRLSGKRETEEEKAFQDILWRDFKEQLIKSNKEYVERKKQRVKEGKSLWGDEE